MYKHILTLICFLFLTNSLHSQIEIINLGKQVNSRQVDYAPIISPDGLTLYFVSQRKGSILDADGKPSHDFWVSTKNDKYSTQFNIPVNLDSSNTSNYLNTDLNEGTATFSPDGRLIYFTGCNRNDGYGNCDIYTSHLTDSGWTKPVVLSESINTKYWESQPSISPDGNRLYFVSNRPGPNGLDNFDIWYSDWDDKEKEWENAINLQAINTKGKEVSPFMAADNVTLFFSSDGFQPNLGGLDFYICRFDQEFLHWTKPAHLDAPINTEDNDQFLSLNVSGDVMYFASKREDLANYSGDLDIYMAFVPSFYSAIILNVTVNDEFTGETINSTVTVINPVTGRKVEDKITQNKKEMQMIISRTDFGNPQDSVKFIDLQVIAKNEKNETTEKILRVKNPRLQEDELRELSDKIGLTLEFANPVTEGAKERTKSDYAILSADAKLIGFDGHSESDLDSLVIEQNSSISMYPLLNYVFFDNNSDAIQKRYQKLNENSASKFTLKALHNQEVLDIYSNMLNIIAYRMKENVNANLTLLGCNTNEAEEANNLTLSESRAKTIKEYLTSVWKIAEERIITKASNLPSKFSNSETEEGRAENRRVEITSDDPNILAPIFSYDTILTPTPPILRFKKPINVKFGEAYWKINLSQGDKIVKEYNGEGKRIKDLDWNILAENLPIALDKPLYSYIEVNDKQVQSTIIARDTVPVRFISLLEKEIAAAKQVKVEKFSLILFDFGSNKLSKENEAIINLVNSKINNKSKVQVYGYTDNIGNEQFNTKLSESRAKAVANLLKTKNVIINGFGESQLLYDNAIPEGRIYCRTVDIIIENIEE